MGVYVHPVVHSGTVEMTVSQTWARLPPFITWSPHILTLTGWLLWCFESPVIKLKSDLVFNRPQNVWVFPFPQCTHVYMSLGKDGRSHYWVYLPWCCKVLPLRDPSSGSIIRFQVHKTCSYLEPGQGIMACDWDDNPQPPNHSYLISFNFRLSSILAGYSLILF